MESAGMDRRSHTTHRWKGQVWRAYASIDTSVVESMEKERSLLSLHDTCYQRYLVGFVYLHRSCRNGWSSTKHGLSNELGVRETACCNSEWRRLATYAPGFETFATSLQRQRCTIVRTARPKTMGRKYARNIG